MSMIRYAALGLSPDGSAIAIQIVLPLDVRPAAATLIGLAALNRQGAAFASEWLGAVILVQLTSFFGDVCDRYALKPSPGQLLELGARLKASGLAPTPVPPAHLRLVATTAPDRLQIVRVLPTGTAPAATFLLAALTLAGTRNAADQVGRTVLDELATLHPHLPATFPTLYVAAA